MQISIDAPFHLSQNSIFKLQTTFLLSVLHLGSFVIGYLIVLYNKQVYPSALISLQIDPTCQENCQMDTYVLLTSTLPMGAIFGVFINIPITYYFGRRKTIIFSDILAIIAFIIFRPFNFIMTTLVSRFIFGLYCGINFSIIPLYSNEILKKSLFSQDNVILTNVSINFGIFFGFFGFKINTDLAIILGICIFRCILFLFFLKFESPSFLNNVSNEIQNNNESNNLEAFEFPSLYSKDFELLDVFLSPFGINLLLAVLMLVFYQFSGISLFCLYSSQIPEINGFVVAALNFFFSFFLFFIVKATKHKRHWIFFSSPLNMILLLIMYTGIGRNSAFGINFIHVLMCLGVQLSFGTVALPIIVKILPDVGVFLSGVGYWGMLFFVSLCVNLKDTSLYYGEDIEFLVFLILSFMIYLILFKYLKENKLHSI